jgi:hypothetical protein
MNAKALSRSMALILAIPLLLAPAQKPTFKTAKDQAIGLHRSLIASARPEVQAKIAASAKAARAYLAKCGRDCDLHAFLMKDIGRRFSVRKRAESQLLEALIFGETIADMSELDQLKLQDTEQKQQQLVQTISNIMKSSHDTLKAIIQNLRG